MQIKRASASVTVQLLFNNKSALLRLSFYTNQRRGRVRRFKPVSGRRLGARFGGMDKKWNKMSGKKHTRWEHSTEWQYRGVCVQISAGKT